MPLLLPILINLGLCSAAELRMMVLNLANFNDWGDWLKRLQKIGRYIANEGVDIMYFSEVRFDSEESSTKGSYMNMAEQLVELLFNLGIECRIHSDPAMYYTHGWGFKHFSPFWEGLTTVICNEKVEMITNEVIFLKSGAYSSDSNQRIAQYARFEYNQSVFGCVNSHWSNDGNDRILDVQETLERLLEWKDVKQQPNILVGDLNAEIDYSPPDSSLLLLKEAGWVDVWREKFSDADANPGYTLFYQREKRVDYIWANDLFYPAIGSIQIVGKRQHDNQSDWWSDHFGLLILVDVNSFGEVTEAPSITPSYPTELPVGLQTQNVTTVEGQRKVMLVSWLLQEHSALFIAILIFVLISVIYTFIKLLQWIKSSNWCLGRMRYNQLNQQNRNGLAPEIETQEMPPDVDDSQNEV